MSRFRVLGLCRVLEVEIVSVFRSRFPDWLKVRTWGHRMCDAWLQRPQIAYRNQAR